MIIAVIDFLMFFVQLDEVRFITTASLALLVHSANRTIVGGFGSKAYFHTRTLAHTKMDIHSKPGRNAKVNKRYEGKEKLFHCCKNKQHGFNERLKPGLIDKPPPDTKP